MAIKINDNIKWILALVASGALFLLTALLLFFCPIGPQSAAAYLADGTQYTEFFIGVACLLLFAVCIIFTTLSTVNFFIFKKREFSKLKIGALINFICVTLVSAAAAVTGHLYSFVFLIFGVLFFTAVCFFAAQPEKSSNNSMQPPLSMQQIKNDITGSGQTFPSIIVIFSTLATFLINSCALLGTPLFLDPVLNDKPTVSSIFRFFKEYGILEQIFCIAFVLLLIANFILLIHVVFKFFTNVKSFLKAGKLFAKYNIFLTFFVMTYSVVKMFIAKFKGEDIFFITYINVIAAYAIYVVFIIFSGRAQREIKARLMNLPVKKNKRKNKLLPLFLQSAMTGITFSMLFVNLFTMTIDGPEGSMRKSYNGWQILQEKGASFQGAVAFIFLVFFMLSTLFLIFTLINYFIDSDTYKQSIMQFTYANLFFQFTFLAIGLFYILMVPSFDGLIKLVFSDFAEQIAGFRDISLSEYVKTSTLSYIPFLLGFTLLIFMQFYCFGNKKLFRIKDGAQNENKKQETSENGAKNPELPASSAKHEDDKNTIDPCPAFSEIDSNASQYAKEYRERKTTGFENPTLRSITQFIIDYAANIPERLSYNTDNISTFIAGLGSSRLSILQGMSGTGKTSLPVVFMQAINGNCDLVEVESSWRDKNELLGYFNEFNGIYTPKKFTQFLYKAALNPDIPTFIVLDEMNLSRIEYYFSDFLSLMEMREQQRTIKLLDTQIYPASSYDADTETPESETHDENRIRKPYLALTGGHTLKIPSNVWFIGTANRDESAFEISDKVYDRAQTLNFNKRAPKITSPILNVPPRFIEYGILNRLFENAKKTEFNAENHPLIISIEEILSNYKISFGNRILKQIEDFVKIYMACNDIGSAEKKQAAMHRAIENIMISKVLRKLELKIIEDKAQLIESFERLNCKQCAEFVRRLADI